MAGFSPGMHPTRSVNIKEIKKKMPKCANIMGPQNVF